MVIWSVQSPHPLTPFPWGKGNLFLVRLGDTPHPQAGTRPDGDSPSPLSGSGEISREALATYGGNFYALAACY
jgi:hypothetical protein